MNREAQIDYDRVHLDNIVQIAITVTDVERARDFYRDTLGMTFLFDAGRMAFFQCASVRFMIGLSDSAPGGGTILYFEVKDIQAAHAALQDRGVSFLSAPHLLARMADHDLWLAEMKDPDGNHLALMSSVPSAE